jgi:hypothetical protein
MNKVSHLDQPLVKILSVGDSPEGPLKQLGKSRLKPAKKPKLNASCLNAHTSTAHAAVAPAAHQGGPLKGSLERAPPRSRMHAYLERAPPRSRVHAYLERAPPRSRVRTSFERARLARGCSARARPFPRAGTGI